MVTTLRYTRTHKVLHWVIAGLVALQFFLADAMEDAFDAALQSTTAGWTSGAVLHAMVGAGIGLMMLWRLSIRLTTDIPPPPDAPVLIQKISRITHWLFYGLLIGMPVFGALAWFLGSDLIAGLHENAGKALIALITLHVAGAAYHHFVLKDTNVIRRVIPR